MPHAMQADAWWILRMKLQVSNAHTGCHKERARVHILHPSLLMQNATSPEPHTQFSTLLWASAVNSPARGGNRQHLSPASRWRNAPHTAVGVTARSRARLHNTQIPFRVKFGGKKHRRSKFPLALFYAVFVPFFQGRHLLVSQSNKTSWYSEEAPAANERRSCDTLGTQSFCRTL